MNNILLTRIYAVLIGALAVVGLFVSGHLFQLMNTDMTLDIVRVILAAYLIYVGFIAKSERLASAGLVVVGVLYVGMAIAGLVNSTLGNVLPSGLTGFDAAFHAVTGVVALAAGAMHLNRNNRTTSAHA